MKIKKGIRVKINGRYFNGHRGTVDRKEPKAEPGEPQRMKWVVKLDNGESYPFDESNLEPI